MSALDTTLPTLVTPGLLDHLELSRLRVECADYRDRERIAREAYLRKCGELEKLRAELTAERLNNTADRRRMDLLVALCLAGRKGEGSVSGRVQINIGENCSLNPADLRAFLDSALSATAPESTAVTTP